MTIPIDQQLQIKQEDVAWRNEADEIVVLELTTTTYLTLSGSGKRLWLSLVGGSTVAELAEELSSEYQIGVEQARSDALSFVSALAERNLLEVRD